MSPTHHLPHNNHTTPQDPFQNRTKRRLPSSLISPLRAEDYIRTPSTAFPKRKRTIDTNEQERVAKAAKLDAAYEADDEDEERDVCIIRVPDFDVESSPATAVGGGGGTWQREDGFGKRVVEQDTMGLGRGKERPWDKECPVLGKRPWDKEYPVLERKPWDREYPVTAEKPWDMKCPILRKSGEEQFGFEAGFETGFENGFEIEGKGGWAVVSARSDPWDEGSGSEEESVFEEEEAGFWKDDDEGRKREEVDRLERWEWEWSHIGDRYTVLDDNQDGDVFTVGQYVG